MHKSNSRQLFLWCETSFMSCIYFTLDHAKHINRKISNLVWFETWMVNNLCKSFEKYTTFFYVNKHMPQNLLPALDKEKFTLFILFLKMETITTSIFPRKNCVESKCRHFSFHFIFLRFIVNFHCILFIELYI